MMKKGKSRGFWEAKPAQWIPILRSRLLERLFVCLRLPGHPPFLFPFFFYFAEHSHFKLVCVGPSDNTESNPGLWRWPPFGRKGAGSVAATQIYYYFAVHYVPWKSWRWHWQRASLCLSVCTAAHPAPSHTARAFPPLCWTFSPGLPLWAKE